MDDSGDFSFWKNLSLISLFFLITPLTLGISLYSIFSIQNTKTIKYQDLSLSGVKVYASLPNEVPSIDQVVTSGDARPIIVGNYLKKYKSPLAGMEEYIVKRSDEMNLDFRLITAIAQQESNLCKIIPPQTHNCWGWGIHSKGTLGFTSYQEAIDTVTLGLRNEYINKGLTTPDTIWTKYTPSSPDGAWAKGVNQFMAEME